MNRSTLSLLALTPFLLLAGCSGGGGGMTVLERTAQAMGGAAALQGVKTQRIAATGHWFEPEQTFQPADAPRDVSTYQVTVTQDLSADRLRYDWSHSLTYPSPANLVFSEVIDGSQGFVDGNDSRGAASRTAMPSVRLAAIRKFNRLTSPLVLLRSALSAPASVETRPDEMFEGKGYHVLALTQEPVNPVRLFIDPDTFLPVKADTLEDDPYYGDTLHEVLFADWRPVGGVMVPFRLTQRISGLGKTITIQTEERSDVQDDVAADASLFAVPADLQVAFDAADGLRGERMTQWFLRRQAIGFPSYADQGLTLTFTETRPGSGLFFATGGTHNTMVVEMADHLVALEPPLYESRSQAVIAAAKAAIPGKPFRYVVASHFHVDHGGGVRAYAAEGATVVVGEAVKEHFEAILAAPHTLVPDALEKNPRTATVIGVPESSGVQFSDGNRTVGVFPVQGQTHAAGYVLSAVSGEDLIFDSGDLFGPPGGSVAVSTLPEPLRQVVQAFGLPVRAIAGAHGSLSAVENDVIALPAGFRPEGVTISGNSLFVGSIPTGRVFRADIDTGRGEVIVPARAGRSSIGLKVDDRGRLFVAGGQTGQAYVYDASTGAELAVYTLAQGDTFINDVTLTPQAAWFTDSRNAILYKVPIGADGSLAAQAAVAPLALAGDFQLVAGQTNANGIAATPDGVTLLIVQTTTGKLFTVEPATGLTKEILLGGETVANGDGILLQGQTLFVVQNRSNQLAVVTLAPDFTTGTVTQRVANPAFDVPTTVAASDGNLYLVNARFGVADPDTASYTVVRIAKP